MGENRGRDSSIDSGYATDKSKRDLTNSVEAKGKCEDPGIYRCTGEEHKLQQFGLDLKPLSGKGLGLVALRDFAKGEVVLLDRALVMVRTGPPSVSWNRQQALSVFRQVAKMNEEEKASLLQLSPRKDSKQPLVLRIISNNCFNIDLNTFGVFPNISRINHSCAPNCIDSAGSDATEKRVLALRRIRQGEELSLSYLHAPEGSKAMRAAELRYWNFVCNCELCLCEGKGESNLRENIVQMLSEVRGFVCLLEKAQVEEPHMDDDQKRLLSASIYCDLGKQLDACETLVSLVGQLSHPPPHLQLSSHLHAAMLSIKKRSLGLAGHQSMSRAEWHLERAERLLEDVPSLRGIFIHCLARVMLAQVNWSYGR